MRAIARALTLLVCLAGPCLADAPVSSIRAHPRPVSAASLQVSVLQSVPGQPVQPRRRPVAQAATVAVSPPRPRPRPDVTVSGPALQPLVAAGAALLAVPRPAPRPRLVPPGDAVPEQVEPVAALRIKPGKSAIFGRKGTVCGDPAIKGEVLAPITSRVRGCGIVAPVQITSVDGVTLKQSAIVDCDTALALRHWVSDALKPSFGRKDVASLRIAGSYACRPRNNVRGAPISEHGRGKAVDIAAVVLADGTVINVANDWRKSSGKRMVKAYHAACGTFGTTLGPDSDSYHRDHMHFDTARQRGGAYCR